MEVKSTSTYPYPIWGLPNNYIGEDPDGIRKVKYKADEDCIIVDYEVTTHNAGIDGLISDGLAAYECIIESSSVYYLDKKIQDSPHFEMRIPNGEVNKVVTCKILIVAIKDIVACTTLDVNEAYEGVVDYPKGAMIAYIDDFVIPLTARDNLTDLSKIITTMATDVPDVEYSLDTNRIIIKYPLLYSSKFNDVESNCPIIIESAFVYPALLMALQKLNSFSDDCTKDWVVYLRLFVDDYYDNIGGNVPEDYKFEDVSDVFDIANFILKKVQLDTLEKTSQLINDSLTNEG